MQLNLPPNYKKDVLFDQLPYVEELNNPTLKDVIRNGITNSKTLQKYLLTMSILEDSIEHSLDMITTDGDFNNAGIPRVFYLKEPNLMKKKTYPVELVFQDNARFETQNPIISKLLKQTQKGKDILNRLPLIKDVEINKRLNKLKCFNRNNNNNNNNSNCRTPFHRHPFFLIYPQIFSMMTMIIIMTMMIMMSLLLHIDLSHLHLIPIQTSKKIEPLLKNFFWVMIY